jgi:hypothetical protein
MECGQGNVLDLIREGKYVEISNQSTGSKRLQKVGFKTFLMKKLSAFLEDDSIFFIPRSNDDIILALRACQNNVNMKFTVQEIGIYERMVEQLKMIHEDQDNALVQAR